MKRFLANRNGIALVTSLMMTLISLTIIMAVMYMITQNIQQTGSHKRYRTALEASYGGVDVVMKEILPQMLQKVALSSTDFANYVNTTYSATILSSTMDSTQAACLQEKLMKETSAWSSTCNRLTNPKSGPDMVIRLQSTTGLPYAVYTKIVDTVFGNTDMSGLQLEGAGVAESLTVITPMHLPYVYRLEIQAERSSNALEQANISVVYAY